VSNTHRLYSAQVTLKKPRFAAKLLGLWRRVTWQSGDLGIKWQVHWEVSAVQLTREVDKRLKLRTTGLLRSALYTCELV
jgi:hypothetical protein